MKDVSGALRHKFGRMRDELKIQRDVECGMGILGKKKDILARAAHARFNQKLRDKFDGMHVR